MRLASSEQELAALEPLRRILELGHMEPAHLALERGPARDHLEVEIRQCGDVANAQHSTPGPKLRRLQVRNQPGSAGLGRIKLDTASKKP